MSDVEHFLLTATELASIAAQIAIEQWRGAFTVEYKPDGSSLTATDLNIEERWRDILKSRHPSHGILGEEYGRETGTSAYTWVLDPIDGTRAYGAGLLGYSSLISLCRDGVPIIGLMVLPQPNLIVLSAEGRGTTFAGKRVRSSGKSELQQATVSLANPESFRGRSQRLYEALRTVGNVRVYDGGSPAYGALSRGLIDVCLNGDDLDAFDICALCPIVTEAGGAISDLDGQPLTLDSSGAILASASPELHQKVLRF